MSYAKGGKQIEKLIINGGKQLNGEVVVDKAKNSILPILASTLLCPERCIIHNNPDYTDIRNMCHILADLGAGVIVDGDNLIIDNSTTTKYFIAPDLAKVIRSSIFALGALLGRFGKARVSYPGGCDIGLRPIDLHLKGLRDLGVDIQESHGLINCDASRIHGGEVYLDYPSVGATENLIMASTVGKKRKTIIHNVAKEPEIEDLQNFINAMGGKVKGAGTSTITIESVEQLHGTTFTPIADRIIAGTYLIAGAMTGGEISVVGCEPYLLQALIDKLIKSSCKVDTKGDKIILRASGKRKCFGFVETLPYPGFPTDLQAQILTMATICRGNSVIRENLFEARYKYVPELIKMGANVVVRDRTAFVSGVRELQGASVYASDLRGGVALVLAGLVARGYTTVNDIWHIDRGYRHIEQTLSELGADIQRI